MNCQREISQKRTSGASSSDQSHRPLRGGSIQSARGRMAAFRDVRCDAGRREITFGESVREGARDRVLAVGRARADEPR